MTPPAKASRPVLVRAALWVGFVLAGVLALAALLRVAAMTPIAGGLVTRSLDGLSIGEASTVRVGRVSGDLLSGFRVTRIALEDAEGVWLEVEEARLEWRAAPLFSRHLSVRDLSAAQVTVFRAPTPSPDGDGDDAGGAPAWPAGWSLTVDRAALDRIDLAEGVAGPAAQFTLEAQAFIDRGAVESAEVTFARADAIGDVLFVTAARNDAGRLVGSIQLEAAAGGPLATVLAAPDSAWSLAARLQDEGGRVFGTARLVIDDADVVALEGAGDEAGATVSGRANLAALPHTRDLTERIGDSVAFRAVADASDGDAARLAVELDGDQFAASFVAPVDLARPFDFESGDLALVVHDLAGLAGIAPGLSAGPLRLTGAVAREDGVAFDGVVAVEDVAGADLSSSRITGPIALRARRGRITLETELAATDLDAAAPLIQVLGATPEASLAMRYGLRRQLAEIASARIAGEHLQVELRGAADLPRGAASLEAVAALSDLASLEMDLAGSISAVARLERGDAESAARVTLEAYGDQFSAAEPPLAELVGPRPSLLLEADIAPSGQAAGDVRLEMANATVEAAGGVDDEGGLDATLDFAAVGPWPVGPAEFHGAVAAAAQLSGSLERPTVRAEARVDRVSAGERALEAVRLRVEAEDLRAAPMGRVRVDAVYDGAPGALSSAFALNEDVLSVRAIDGRWGGAVLEGGAEFAAGRPVAASLDASDAQGRVTASLDLLDQEGESYLLLEADAGETSIGDALFLQSGSLRAEGPLNEIALSAAATGVSAAEFDLSLTGGLSLDQESGPALLLRPQGRIGRADISTIRPLVVSQTGDTISATGMLAANGGRAELNSAFSPAGLDLTLDWADLPLALLDATRDEAQLAGRLTGAVSVSGGDVLSGRAEVRMVDARLAHGAPASGVDGELVATLSEDGLEFNIAATDPAGFIATAFGDAPLRLSASPFAVDLPGDAPHRLTLSAGGPIAGLWALMGSENIDLDGELNADIEVTGTADDPAVTGEIYLQDGRLEDSVAGLRLLNAAALATFDRRRIVITDVDARDGVGGVVSGSGELRLARVDSPSGRITVALDSYRLADRGDARMTASGEVELLLDEGEPSLEADVRVEEAEFAPVGAAGQAGQGVPTLDVTEINRPPGLERRPETARQSPVALEAAVRADRRVFVRAPGLETEWAFDLEVRGDTAEPDVRGTATLLRGQVDLAGERFEFDEGSIRIAGAIDDARLDLAARRDATDLTAIVRISGTVAEPTISLESTPAYPEDEILARVLFDRSASELTALEAAQLAAALAQLARGGIGVTDMLRQQIGLDRLRVGGSAEEGAIVTGGKYVADGVYLEVGARGETGAEAAIEWEIRPRLELVSRFGGSQEAEVALRWRKDY